MGRPDPRRPSYSRSTKHDALGILYKVELIRNGRRRPARLTRTLSKCYKHSPFVLRCLCVLTCTPNGAKCSRRGQAWTASVLKWKRVSGIPAGPICPSRSNVWTCRGTPVLPFRLYPGWSGRTVERPVCWVVNDL